MVAPPLLDGAVHRTVAETSPAVAVPIVGALGTAAGVTVFDAPESAPAPLALTARTTKLYAVPLVNPVIVVLVALPGVTLTVRITVVPVRTSTWKPVSAVEPVSAGAVQLTVAVVLPRTAATPVGAPGVPTGAAESANSSRSMLNSVSLPSPVAGAPTAGGVLVVSVTVTEPFAFGVIVYCVEGPENTAVSQLTGAVAPQSGAAVTR